MGLFDKFFSGKRQEKPVEKTVTEKIPRKVTGKRRGNLPRSEGTPYYKIVCPYCLEQYDIWKLEFRSESVTEGEDQTKGYPRVRDEKYVNFWNRMRQPVLTMEKNFVLNLNDTENVLAARLWDSEDWIPLNTPEQREKIKKKAIRAVKDKFGRATSRRICPMCHNDLPDVIGRYPNYVISLMGNTSSGKTVYAARLMLSLLNFELLPGRDMVVTIPNEINAVVIKRLKDMFTTSVKKKKTQDSKEADQRQKALSEATPIKYMKPIILDLQKQNEHVLVTLFDFPGEAIWKNEIWKQENLDLEFFRSLMQRMNENTSGWLFMLDSTTLIPVRSLVMERGEQDYLSQENLDDELLNAEPSQVLTQFSQLFGDSNMIKPPVAFVFSKADMITRYVPSLEAQGYAIHPNSTFLQETPDTKRSNVDVDDLWKSDQEIRSFLANDPVLRVADNFYPRHAWFAASATGSPIKNGELQNNSPCRRVVEPLEWLLWMGGAYAGTYTQGNVEWADNDKPE